MTRADVAEELLAYFVLFSIALSYFYNFVMHVFFGEIVAPFIGWADSPFQLEVAYASLGFAAVGLFALNTLAVRFAAILGPSLFLWGPPAGTSTRSSRRTIFTWQCRHDALHRHPAAGHRLCAIVVQAETGARPDQHAAARTVRT